jgi:hypothetical protein
MKERRYTGDGTPAALAPLACTVLYLKIIFWSIYKGSSLARSEDVGDMSGLSVGEGIIRFKGLNGTMKPPGAGLTKLFLLHFYSFLL